MVKNCILFLALAWSAVMFGQYIPSSPQHFDHRYAVIVSWSSSFKFISYYDPNYIIYDTSNTYIASYTIYRATVVNGVAGDYVPVGLSVDTTWEDTVVDYGTTYLYKVTATDIYKQESAPSNIVTVPIPNAL